MKKSKKDMCKDLSFTVDRNELALNSRKFRTEEISRGTGIIRPKKGKGSYTRKRKYKEDYSCDSLTGIFLVRICHRGSLGDKIRKGYITALHRFAAKLQRRAGVITAVAVIIACAANAYTYAVTTDKYGNNTLKSFKNMHEIKWDYMSKTRNRISWQTDLNNDKKNERINVFQNIDYKNYEKSIIKLTINNSTVNIQADDREIKGVAVLDINKKDNFKEIAVYTLFSSDDDEVLFYRFVNNKVVYIDTLPLVTDVVPGEVTGLYINNDGILSVPLRVGVFQSHAQRKYYKFDNKTFKFLELKQPFDYLQGNIITALKNLNMKSSLKVSKKDLIIQKGEKLKVIGTYKERWVLLKRMNGKECWFDVSEEKEWYNLFKGLIMYD